MSRREVGVGIVGGGLMGREIAAALARWPALVDHPVVPRLTAVADINPKALAWFDAIDTVTRLTDDYRDLLRDPQIDVIYIAVRHDLHEQLYIDTIESGKALLAEKPFGIDRAAADNILRSVEAHPESFVRVSSEMPFFPGAQAAIDFVRSGAVGRVIEARSAFLHSSDFDLDKPINWKRRQEFCGRAGVMNDLGMHAWHVPLRLGWAPNLIHAVLQDLVPMRSGPEGSPVACDTFENASILATVGDDGNSFPLAVETKRIDPGEKNTWTLVVKGLEGSVAFSTKLPKTVRYFQRSTGERAAPIAGDDQVWQSVDIGSQSVWPTITGGIFETGFSDAILQMWAAFLAEYAGELGDRFGCATPQEAWTTHRLFEAAIASHQGRTATEPVYS